MKWKLWKRIFLGFVLLFVVLAVWLAHPVYHLFRTYLNDPYFHGQKVQEQLPAGKVNDASHLDETAVNKFWPVTGDPAAQ